jgi:hypothetical protein
VAGVRCLAGYTRWLDILGRVAALDVALMIMVGDVFEESTQEACRLADVLGARGTRVIVLHDGPPPDVFGEIAGRTGGALLPFDNSGVGRVTDLLAAAAMLAVGGTELLEAKRQTMPAAKLLLEHLRGSKRIGRR